MKKVIIASFGLMPVFEEEIEIIDNYQVLEDLVIFDKKNIESNCSNVPDSFYKRSRKNKRRF